MPGLKADYNHVNFDELYKPEELVVFDEEEAFRTKLTDFQLLHQKRDWWETVAFCRNLCKNPNAY